MITSYTWPLVISILFTLGLFPITYNNPPLLKEHHENTLVIGKEEQEEIDCSNFISAVLQWRADLFKFFRTNKTTYAKVSINIQQFREELSLAQSPIPIVKALYEEWQELLNNMEPELTGEQLFEQLMNHSGSTWQLTNDLKALEVHYKKNKKAYKQQNITMDVFQEKAMPKQQYFLDALKVSTAKEDPNLPENVEKAAEQQEQWEQDYKAWLNENIDELSHIDSTEEGKVINKNALANFRSIELTAPAYAQDFWEATGQAIEQAILGEKGAVSYKKATKIAIDILDETYQQYITQEFLQAAVESGLADLPIGLEDWLRACLDNNETLYKQFYKQWQRWSQGAGNIVALCENKMEGKTYTVDMQKLEQEMSTAFSYTINGTTPGADIWKHLKSSLPQDKTTSFEQLHTAWQNGIEKLQTTKFARGMWTMYLTNGYKNENLEQDIAQFFAKAPSQEVLVDALLNARH